VAEESTPTTTPEVNIDPSGNGVVIASPGAKPGSQPGGGNASTGAGPGAVSPDDTVVNGTGSGNGTAGAAEEGGTGDYAAGGASTGDLSQYTCGYTLPEGESTIIDDPSLPDWMQVGKTRTSAGLQMCCIVVSIGGALLPLL
jgi:hypothetical protein